MTVEDGFVMMIGGDGLGRGDAELGRLLMTKFLHELGGQRSLPEKVIFVNHGVKLVVRDSPVLGQIQHLEHTGVEVAACGTCLQRLGLEDEVAVGGKTDMCTTVTTLAEARKAVSV